MFQIQVYFYRYRDSPPSSNSSCTYLESPQDIHSSPRPTLGARRQPANTQEPLILIRERGGRDDNHVQWVPISQVEAISPYRGTSYAHGVIRRGNWVNEVGQLVWLRSDMPLRRGKNSCPAVNLGLSKSVEVRIGDVTWRADKIERKSAGAGREEGRRVCESQNTWLASRGQQGISLRGPLTLAGPEYRYNGVRFRMCLTASGTGDDGFPNGVLEAVSVEDIERYYEDVGLGT